jgi:zinc transporter ZupT
MVTHLFMTKKTNKEIFIWPILLGVLTLLGLIVALVIDDSIWEPVSLLGLLLPIFLAAYFYWFKKWP